MIFGSKNSTRSTSTSIDYYRQHSDLRNPNLSGKTKLNTKISRNNHKPHNSHTNNNMNSFGLHDPTAFDASKGAGAIDINTCFYVPSKRRVNTSHWVRAKKHIPKCWLCGIEVKQFGWRGMPSTLLVLEVASVVMGRKVYTPERKTRGSPFITTLTLCQQCCVALSMSCDATVADVLNASKDTFVCRSRSVPYVAFLREYKLLLEVLGMDINDVIDDKIHRRSHDPYNGLYGAREEGSLLSQLGGHNKDILHNIQEQLDECILDALTNVISKLTEREVLLNERNHIYSIKNMMGYYCHDTSSEVLEEVKTGEPKRTNIRYGGSFNIEVNSRIMEDGYYLNNGTSVDPFSDVINGGHNIPTTGEKSPGEEVSIHQDTNKETLSDKDDHYLDESHTIFKKNTGNISPISRKALCELDHHMTGVMIDQFEQLLESTVSLGLDMMFKKTNLMLHESLKLRDSRAF
eukprot:Tbor_TRINITY_DN3309_c0_g1::TRINITY_DN3309_c0_g1_i1::g.23547::m.23547